jgi:hypothetical protein
MPAFEFTMKVGQLVDGIGSADFDLLIRAQPRKSFFKQLEHPLDKCPRRAILFGHRITSIILVVKWMGCPVPRDLNQRG